MMKLMGILLVLGAGGAMGIMQSYRMRTKVREIRSVIQVLSSMESQIVYAQVLLGEAFSQGAVSANEMSVKRFFCCIGGELSANRRCAVTEAFAKARREHGGRMAIGVEEWNVLAFLSENLGKSNIAEMKKQMALAIEHLKSRECIALEQASRKEKLAIYLGICGALFIVLICV